MKYVIYILLALICFSCNDDNVKKDEPLQQENNKVISSNTKVSDIKINNEVKPALNNNSGSNVVNDKTLIPSEKLFDFFPKKYENITLEEESSGTSNSGAGKFTTATGVFQKKHNFIRMRLSDYLSGKNFPDLKYLINIPQHDDTFTFEKADLGNGIIGYIQWHKAEDYGIINLFLYNRFNIYLEIDGFPKIKTNYKELIQSFHLQKLNKISTNK